MSHAGFAFTAPNARTKMPFGPVGASAATVAAVAVGPLSRSRASEPAARCACDHETRIRENTGNFVRLQHGAHSTASRLLQTSTWRERGTLPNPPQPSPQHNPVVLPLVSTHAKLRSGSVSESFHFYCRMFTGEHWLQAHCVFSKKKKRKKVEPCNYKADALVWLLLFFCPNSTPHPPPTPPCHLLPPPGCFSHHQASLTCGFCPPQPPPPAGGKLNCSPLLH